MIENKILTVDLQLQSIAETGGVFTFTAKSLSKDFECEKGRKILSEESKGKPYIWRHKHPIQEGNTDTHIYGKVVDSWLENGEIFSKYQMYNHTDEHKAIIEVIKERHEAKEPLGVSMRYRKYLKNKVPIHYDVFEHSGTPYPKCEDCNTIEFGVQTMTNEENIKQEEKKVEEDVLEDSISKIKKLEELLNSKTDILNELEKKVEAYRNEMLKKDSQLEKKEIVEKSLEEKVQDLKNEVDYLTKKPLIDKILEFRSLDEAEIGFYKTQPIKYLEDKLEQISKEVASAKNIEVKTQEESMNESINENEKELEKKEPTMEEFTKHLNLKKKSE